MKNLKNFNAAELAGIINSVASLWARDKNIDEIEIMAFLFDMLSDTLWAIAKIEKHQDRLRRRDDTS
jgi:hypothetical protein